jgi:hypothetical protein
VGHGANRLDAILHGQVNVACAGEVLELLADTHNAFLRFEVATPTRAEVTPEHAGGRELLSLGEHLLFLAVLSPVGVDFLEVDLAGKRQKRHFPEDGAAPQALDLHLEIVLLVQPETHFPRVVAIGCQEVPEGAVDPGHLGFTEEALFLRQGETGHGLDATLQLTQSVFGPAAMPLAVGKAIAHLEIGEQAQDGIGHRELVQVIVSDCANHVILRLGS